ncbi:MAG: twin-arginine translocase TatA/TatE family subunit [Gemmataceae bacterium]
MFGLGGTEMLILLVLGVLLFGKRLPEVGRSLGKGLMEFKKGIAGIEDEVHGAINRSDYDAPAPARPPQRIAASAPKYEEPNDNNQPVL